MIESRSNYLSPTVIKPAMAAHRNEFLEFISQLGFTTAAELRSVILEVDPAVVPDEFTRTLLRAGQGKMLTIEGNFLAARQRLNEALGTASRLHSQKPGPVAAETLAYVLYEMGLFFRPVSQKNHALEHFHKAAEYARSPNLKLLISYQLATLDLEVQKSPSIEPLLEYVDQFVDLKMEVMTVLSLHRVGVLLRNQSKYDKSRDYYDQALQLAQSNGFHYPIYLTRNSIGYLELVQKKYDTAEEIFQDIVNKTISPYLQAIITENLALTHYLQNQFEQALSICHRALEISQKHHIFSQIPQECGFLADVYHTNLKQPSKAEFYYRLGYEQVMVQIANGLTLSGPRAEAVDEYVKFLQSYFPKSARMALPEPLLSFALGKSWQEIKDLFQYNYIIFLKTKHGVNQKLFDRLELKPTTFYTLQARLARKGYSFPDFRHKDIQFAADNVLDSLQIYLPMVDDLTWRQAHDQFEKDIIQFLFGHHGYQQKRLAQALKISMSALKKKTQALETNPDKYVTAHSSLPENSISDTK